MSGPVLLYLWLHLITSVRLCFIHVPRCMWSSRTAWKTVSQNDFMLCGFPSGSSESVFRPRDVSGFTTSMFTEALAAQQDDITLHSFANRCSIASHGKLWKQTGLCVCVCVCVCVFVWLQHQPFAWVCGQARKHTLAGEQVVVKSAVLHSSRF